MKIIRKINQKYIKARRKYKRKKSWDLYVKILANNGFKIVRERVDEPADIYYLMESPEILIKVNKIDFNHENLQGAIVFASFNKPDGNKAKIWINTTVNNHLLSDKFCEMPKKIEITNYKNKAIMSRSQKTYLSGHKVRHQISEFENMDILELDGTIENTNFIYKQYKYMVVIENTISPGYVTEKLFDAIKCGCAVIYMGDYNNILNLGFKNIFKLDDINNLEFMVNNVIEKDQWSEEIAIENLNLLYKLREKSLYQFLAFPTYHLYIENLYETY